MEANVEDLIAADETQTSPHQLTDLKYLYIIAAVILLLYVHSHHEGVPAAADQYPL